MTVSPPRVRPRGRLYGYWLTLQLNVDAVRIDAGGTKTRIRTATTRVRTRRKLYEELIRRHGPDAVLRHSRAIARAIQPAERAVDAGLSLARLTRLTRVPAVRH